MKTKTVLIILGVCALLFCGFCGLGGAFLFKKGVAVQGEAMAAIKPTVENIAKTWDADALLARATPELKSATPKEVAKGWMDHFRAEFGVAKSFREATMTNIATSTVNGDSKTTLTLVYDAEFEKKPGVITVEVVKTTGDWQIQSYKVK